MVAPRKSVQIVHFVRHVEITLYPVNRRISVFCEGLLGLFSC